MTLAAFIVFVVAVLGIAAVNSYSLHRATVRQKTQDAADEGRRQAIYQQQKASQTEIARLQRAGEVLADQSRALHEETRLVHQRVDRFFAHPHVKRMLEEQQPNG